MRSGEAGGCVSSASVLAVPDAHEDSKVARASPRHVAAHEQPVLGVRFQTGNVGLRGRKRRNVRCRQHRLGGRSRRVRAVTDVVCGVLVVLRVLDRPRQRQYRLRRRPRIRIRVRRSSCGRRPERRPRRFAARLVALRLPARAHLRLVRLAHRVLARAALDRPVVLNARRRQGCPRRPLCALLSTPNSVLRICNHRTLHLVKRHRHRARRRARLKRQVRRLGGRLRRRWFTDRQVMRVGVGNPIQPCGEAGVVRATERRIPSYKKARHGSQRRKLGRKRARQLVVHQVQRVEVRETTQFRRHFARQLVGPHVQENQARQIAQLGGYTTGELIPLQKQHPQTARVSQPGGNRPRERILPQVERVEAGQIPDRRGQRAIQVVRVQPQLRDLIRRGRGHPVPVVERRRAQPVRRVPPTVAARPIVQRRQ